MKEAFIAIGGMVAVCVGLPWLWYLFECRSIDKLGHEAWARLGRPWEYIPGVEQCACGKADYGVMVFKDGLLLRTEHPGCSDECRARKKAESHAETGKPGA